MKVILMDNKLTIYHGSTQTIETPIWGAGNPRNDYGLGFYCTQSIELAKEWACTEKENGFSNKYQLDINDLSILNLNSGDYHVLNWLAVLLENRTFRIREDVTIRAKEYILENFSVNYKEYDIVCGYRADDSYFSYANAFLNNTLSLKKLEKAMLYGNLGEQIVLRTEKAFGRLFFLESEVVDREIYYPKKLARDMEAREAFRKDRSIGIVEEETYVLDIVRGRWKDDDTRLQRRIFG